jgi:gliding motility-associated-like protein
MLLSICSLSGQDKLLILQLTDPDDTPLLSSVKITSHDESETTLVPNELGQIVTSFAPGDYTYEINYGDYSTGKFSISAADDFVWINLDFSKATITLHDGDGNPLPDEEVNMYKIRENGSDSLFSTKKTDENGAAEFILLDKEKYKYTALLQQEIFEMDGSLDRNIDALSVHSLMPVYFGFKKDGVVTNVAAGNIRVYRKNDAGNYVLYGESPAKDAPGGAGYNLFDSPVSCKPGDKYRAEVSTGKYGKLTVEYTCLVTPEMKDTVYFLIETAPIIIVIPPDTIPVFPPDDPSEWEGEVVILTVKTVWKDPESDHPDAPFLISDRRFDTDNHATRKIFVYKNAEYTIETIFEKNPLTYLLTQDTTIILYYDDYYKVNFEFRLNGETVTPASVRTICVNSDNGTNKCTSRSYECGGQFCTVYATPANYTYSFSINEFKYTGQMSDVFEIPETIKTSRGKDTTIYFDLVKKNEVKFVVLDLDGAPSPYQYAGIFKYKDGVLLTDSLYDFASHSGFTTDEFGAFTDYLLDGDYQAVALDTVFDFSINSDATIILQRKASDARMKKVYFKFLLEGKEVFPQVMRMDLLNSDSTNYSYIIPSIRKDEEGNDYNVFDKPARCFAGEYIYSFLLRDLGFNGVKNGSFTTALSAREDTTIFIVLPIKPKVEITVLDKDLKPIVNVYGAIYKYNDDGTLDANPFFDDFTHNELKTDDSGLIWDKLMPGKYRFIIDGIVQRDFVVGEYDVKFQVISGVDYYTTTFIVKDTKGNPITNTLLEIKQGEDFYSSNLTDENGEMKIENESGAYTYYLDYGNGKDSTYHIFRSDTTIYIVVEELVYTESIAVKGCRCLQIGESIRLFPEITPENATFLDVNWSIDNHLYANISSRGILTANEAGIEGNVTVTATAKDKSGISGTKEIQIKQNCDDAKIALFIGETGVKDTTVAGGTILLLLGETDTKTENPVSWFVYQYSTDQTTWKNINADPVRETAFTINAKDYNPDETVYFRVIAAEDEETAKTISETEETAGACISYSISTTVTYKMIDIFQDWTNSVCSSDAEVTLSLSKESLAIIEQAGTTVEWYMKTDDAADFVKINVPKENQLNPSFTLTGKTTFKVKIVNESQNFTIEFEQAIEYISVSGFKINASETVACAGDLIELSVNNTDYPVNSYKWFNESEETTITVRADETEYWAVLKACPSDTARITLTIDDSLKIKLTADKELICETETNPIRLLAEITQGKAGTFSWSPDSPENTSSVSVLPDKTTQYSVTVKTALDKCPATEDSITVTVEQETELTLSADNYDICQDNDQLVTLTAYVQNGIPEAYLWWDGETTAGPERTIIPVENAIYSVQAKGTACSLSDTAYSDEVKVATASPVNLSVKTTVVNLGEPARLEAITGNTITGPYYWYLVEEDSETLLGETNEPVFEHSPSKSVAYLVKAENGGCPVTKSLQAAIRLVDATKIPTAFTPYDKDGLNDDFMPGYTVFIYDRYGNLICDSEDGWDGTYRGKTADAGVYIYSVTMKDDRVEKGTIEVIRLK